MIPYLVLQSEIVGGAAPAAERGALGPMESPAMNASGISGTGGIDANLSPDAFHRWATQYYMCRHDFASPHKFSPVPYFLLCRAIELELKSRHLQGKRQLEVKRAYGHDLTKAYAGLPPSEQILTPEEVVVLEQASDIYAYEAQQAYAPAGNSPHVEDRGRFMTDTPFRRDNHYVPCGYLKRWAARDGRVWTYRILVPHPAVHQWKPSSPRGVAYHSHLYTRLVAGRETDEVEKWLDSEFEAPAQEAIEKATSHGRLTPDDWERMLRFLAAQDVRTPAWFDEQFKR